MKTCLPLPACFSCSCMCVPASLPVRWDSCHQAWLSTLWRRKDEGEAETDVFAYLDRPIFCFRRCLLPLPPSLPLTCPCLYTMHLSLILLYIFNIPILFTPSIFGISNFHVCVCVLCCVCIFVPSLLIFRLGKEGRKRTSQAGGAFHIIEREEQFPQRDRRKGDREEQAWAFGKNW